MGKRIMVAVVCIPLLLFIMFGLPPIALAVAISLLSMIGVHEMLRSTGCAQDVRVTASSILLAGLIPLWIYFGGEQTLGLAGLFLYVVSLFLFAMRSHKQLTMEKMGIAFFSSVMIPYFLAAFLRIRQMDRGIYLLILPIVSAFLSDAFALFAGMLFGKHKLAPELSPKKTVEGAVGGLFGSVVGCLVYGAVMEFGLTRHANFGFLVICGLLGSLISQIGDLSFSYVKRQYGIKDYGTLFPGHGGVLDRFDSVLFCAPLFEVLFHLLPVLG